LSKDNIRIIKSDSISTVDLHGQARIVPFLKSCFHKGKYCEITLEKRFWFATFVKSHLGSWLLSASGGENTPPVHGENFSLFTLVCARPKVLME
jgi:hypothetical protein